MEKDEKGARGVTRQPIIIDQSIPLTEIRYDFNIQDKERERKKHMDAKKDISLGKKKDKSQG